MTNEIDFSNKVLDDAKLELAEETLKNNAAIGQIVNLYMGLKLTGKEELPKIIDQLFETKIKIRKHLQGMLLAREAQEELSKSLGELEPNGMTPEETEEIMKETTPKSEDWDL